MLGTISGTGGWNVQSWSVLIGWRRTRLRGRSGGPTLAALRRVLFVPKPYDFEPVAALIAKVIAGASSSKA